MSDRHLLLEIDGHTFRIKINCAFKYKFRCHLCSLEAIDLNGRCYLEPRKDALSTFKWICLYIVFYTKIHFVLSLFTLKYLANWLGASLIIMVASVCSTISIRNTAGNTLNYELVCNCLEITEFDEFNSSINQLNSKYKNYCL